MPNRPIAPYRPARRARSGPGWSTLLGAPLALAAGWIGYSRLAIDHNQSLPPALPGERFSVETPAGRVNVYVDGPESGPPMLLIHSVNAAGSAYEMRPLFMHYRATRRVYAMDLPGFGFSEREDKTYTPRLMTDAVEAVAAAIRARSCSAKIDAIALSLACEYAARAAVERPEDYRSLGLISPTGFEGARPREGREGANRGNAFVLSAVSVPIWSRATFDLLTTGPSIRFFLEKTWGGKAIDEGLLHYDRLTTHQPGAEFAVWSFLAGYLFSDDIARIYERLNLPVWVIHGQRGDFVDYRRLGRMAQKPNWTTQAFDTGALPQFERPDAVVRSYDAFAAAHRDADAPAAALL